VSIIQPRNKKPGGKAEERWKTTYSTIVIGRLIPSVGPSDAAMRSEENQIRRRSGCASRHRRSLTAHCFLDVGTPGENEPDDDGARCCAQLLSGANPPNGTTAFMHGTQPLSLSIPSTPANFTSGVRLALPQPPPLPHAQCKSEGKAINGPRGTCTREFATISSNLSSVAEFMKNPRE
jgi:hypothetical protein